MPFWDERFAEIAARYPDIENDKFHIDILTAHFVQRPERFQVVVGSNVFGAILSDPGRRMRKHRHRAVRQHQS